MLKEISLLSLDNKNNTLESVSTEDIFKNKKVVIFGLPGAFTPTCTTSHVPGFETMYDDFIKQGVDEIYVVSVNDAFVMKAWMECLSIKRIKYIADGNGELTEELGMLVDKSELGFGKRSWRYSAYVVNGKVEKLFAEEKVPGDPFEVSDADSMMKFLNPEFKKQPTISMFVKDGCSFCKKAKLLLEEFGLQYNAIPLGVNLSTQFVEGVSGRSTFPQVFFDGNHIGGYEDLEKYLNN